MSNGAEIPHGLRDRLRWWQLAGSVATVLLRIWAKRDREGTSLYSIAQERSSLKEQTSTQEEMPSIERLQEEYRDKGLEVWGVTDDSEDKAQKFLTDNHRALPTLIDQGRSVFKKYEIKGIPVLVLIDRDGKVAKFWDGMQYEKDIRAALEPVLKWGIPAVWVVFGMIDDKSPKRSLGGDERYHLSTTVYTGADDDQQKAPAG